MSDHDDQASADIPGGRGAERGAAHPGLDISRPFGVHIRMAWWKSIVLIAAVPLALIVSQLGLYLLAGLVEGDPFAPTLTPLKLLAANVSTGLTALLALVLVVRFAKVPWRSVFSARWFDARRVVIYFLASLVIVGVAMGLVLVIAPDAVGWAGFGLSSTTLALLVVMILSTPIQAAGEEVMLRGAVMPAAGSWFRSVRPAVISGLVVSSLMFALVHGTGDPWLFGYYLFFSICTVIMGLITRGLEAAMAFHVANNLVTTTINALLADGGVIVVDRSEGQGGGVALIGPAAASLIVLGVVWIRERSLRSRRRS
ncbi:MAG: CPBP family intramembrane glutamic endopeptidase [Actinomycetota bacterium]